MTARVAAMVALACAAVAGCTDARTGGPMSDPVILFLGDSITAGSGVEPSEAFPSLIQGRIDDERLGYSCVNAGVGGDTSTGGLARAAAYLDPAPHLVVVELGANDAFKGIDRRRTASNLVEIIETFQQRGSRVILAGVALANFHPALARSMAHVYRLAAEQTGATLVAELLHGVVRVRELNTSDGIHPNADGHALVAQSLWPVLRAELDAPTAAKSVRAAVQKL